MNDETRPTGILAQVERYLLERLQCSRLNRRVQSAPLFDLVGQVLAADVFASTPVPRFRRAMMDGVAINFQRWAFDKHQKLVESNDLHDSTATSAIALPVATGGRIPDGFDTVVPREKLELGETSCDGQGRWVEVVEPGSVRLGQHVASIGEDVQMGQRILAEGRVIRSQDLGLLSACGLTEALVYCRTRVAIAMTGDEVVGPGATLVGDQVHDANGPVLQALLKRDGADVLPLEYLADDPESIRRFLMRKDAEVLVLCGGTSVGPRDFVATSLQEVGRIAFHGLPLRPGRPVGIGETASATVFLLPGNPIACQFTYELLAGPLLRGLSGQSLEWPYVRQLVQLTEVVASQVGRLDCLRVARVHALPSNCGRTWGQPRESANDTIVPLVRPIASGRASSLTSVSEADGFVLIPVALDQLSPSDRVVCYWYDR